MDFCNSKLRIGLFTSALLLTGCGGGGDDSGGTTPVTPVDPTNQSPTISLVAPTEAIEQEAFTLKADATDNDGSIASYSWSHDAGIELTSDSLSAANATFTSPDITEDITVNFTVTVTDDKGATASKTQEIVIKRKVSNVTITGLVTDEPIANAMLEIVVGDESFPTQADASGRYNILLDIDESSSKKLVRVKAKGLDASNPGVEFVSQLSSVEKLLAQAGDDNTLDSTDNFGVNITNVTTAEYALLTRGGVEPSNEEELDTALLNVDADEKIQLATLIKIVVDNPDYQLPEGVNSTLELVTDEAVAQKFENEVNEKDPEIIEKTKEEIKQDDDLVTGSKTSLVGDYIINSPRYHNSRAYHLLLNEDGSGTFNSITQSELTWESVDGVIKLSFENPVVNNEYTNTEENTSNTIFLNTLSFEVLAENDVFRTLDVTETTSRKTVNTVTGEETLTPEVPYVYTSNLIHKSKTLTLTEGDLIGTWVLDTVNLGFHADDPETIIFNNDGTGEVVTDNNEPFTWSLSGTKLSVMYDNDGDVGVTDFWFTKALRAGYQLVTLDANSDEAANSTAGLLIKKEPVSLTNEDFIGRWHGYIGTAQSFDMNVYPDGTVMIGLGHTSYQGEISDGKFTRKLYLYDNNAVTSCTGFDDSCYLSAQMRHEFLNVKDDYYYVLRTFEYFDPEGKITSSIESVLVYQYSKSFDYTEFTEELLSQWTELYRENGGTDFLYPTSEGYTLELNGEQFTGLTFVDGVLSYEVDGITWFLELVSADENEIIVCHYQQGTECSAATQISYLAKRPKVTLTANSNDNGELSPVIQESFIYQNVGFEIIPADGYVVDSIEGCEGYIEGEYYIAFASNVDCEINTTFKEQQESIGSFIIGNQDLYYASAYTVELLEDNTGSLTYNGKVDITWSRSAEGVIEITPLSDFVLQEYESYSNSTGMNVATKDIAIKLTLTPLPEKGSNWFELARDIEQFQDDVLVDEYTSSYEVNKTNLDQRLVINDDDIVGEWSVDLVGEDTVYKVTFSDDGTGVSHNISDLSDESFTWQVTDNTMVLNFPEDGGTESLYITKDLNVGYQVVTQGVFEGEHYTDSGIMVRRNQQAITADNFAGRHQFRDGHGIDTHWSEIQVYDDGEIFFTFTTSAYQRGFEDGHLKRDLYTEYVDGRSQRVDWCDVTLDSCTLEGEFIYTLVAVDGQRYFIERTLGDGSFDEGTTAHLYIHDYSPSTEVNQFYEYDLDYIGLYQNDSNGIARWFVTYGDYDEAQDKQYYTFQIDDTEPVNVTLFDGKLELILDGQDTVIELMDNNRRDVTFCKYLKGNTCQPGDEVYLSFDAPEHTITVNSDGNGSLAVGDDSNVTHGSNWSTSINPNSGYELDEISGCDGYEDGSDYRIPYVKESCQIDVTFKEFIPLSAQANITDPALAMCVDSSDQTSLEDVTELRCHNQYNGEITSLSGLEVLPNLQVLELENINVGTDLDLSSLEGLTEFSIGYNIDSEQQAQIENVTFYDPSLITRLELRNQHIVTIDLSAYTSLQYLSLFYTPLIQIDLSNQTQLVNLDLQGTVLSQLDLTFNTQLESLRLNSGNLTELNIGHLTELRDAYLWDQGNVTELDITNLQKLTWLRIGRMGISSIDLSNQTELVSLDIRETLINNLDFSKLDSLASINVRGVEESLVPWDQLYLVSSISMGGQSYSSFNFSPFTNLTYLSVVDSSITEFATIANPQQLQTLSIRGNSALTQLDISAMTSLQDLILVSTAVTNLDFSNNANLQRAGVIDNPLHTVVGVEAITSNSAVLSFENNPLSSGTVSYLDDLRDNQGYYNISYSVSYSVTVNVIGNGSVSESSFLLSDGASRGINLYPDSGYEVASVTGCNGTWDSTDYYEVGPITESCEVNVEFVETTP
ncbi:hypothetical protein B5G52_11260 [Pseudoalteromonas sp. A601]|uniref:leucine-rich repeat domain-containing protein n=2 Tax=Bacteria TaxID=2 RepID=UPI000B3BFB89|nr:hypothetical protein [Pseudoalteromonas sp. A601]OUS71517.1 hypothetical protein B5G52_11260 [Pseudoalteromonas sp. A601]